MAPNPRVTSGGLTLTRRVVLRLVGLLAAGVALLGGRRVIAQAAQTAGAGAESLADAWGALLQQQYTKMTPEEVKAVIGRIERRTKRQHGVDISVGTEPPLEGVVFGYALNVSRCKGVRRCVEACVAENNLSRDPQIQYIRVLEMDHGDMNLNRADHYYDAETVPRPGKFYLPVQCMQCDNPPCVKACPVEATWQERDGITVSTTIGASAAGTACRHAPTGPVTSTGASRPSPRRRSILTPTISAIVHVQRALSRSVPSASSAREKAASRPAWKRARPARGSSATSSTPRAISATCSRTRRSSD
jgi:ferredoxin